MSEGFEVKQRMQYGFFDFDETLVKQNTFRLLCRQLGSKFKLVTSIFQGLIDFSAQKTELRECIRLSMYKNALTGLTKNQLINAGKLIGKQLEWNELIVNSLLELKKQGAEIIVITASPRIFVEPIIRESGLPVDKVVGTELVFHEDKFTGEFLGKECVKGEKVERMSSMVSSIRLETKSISFGNPPDDCAMLEKTAIGIAVDKATGLAHEIKTRKEYIGCKFEGRT